VSEPSDEPQEPEDAPEEPVDDDEEERWGGEESLGMLPAD
jgi:hypothetical protein